MATAAPANAFSGEVSSVRTVLNLLKSIQIKNIATCNIYDEGITFTCVETHRIKAIAYLRRHMFESYRKQQNQDIPTFGVGLNTLIDCLSLLGPASTPAADTCKFRYSVTGSHLEIIRDDRENNVSTNCRLVTLEPDEENMELSLNDDRNLSQQLIMKSSWLKEAMSDVDNSCERIIMTFSPTDPCFSLSGEGNIGTFQMEYQEHSEPFISFHCHEEASYSYHASHIAYCNKALDQSDEVSLRVSRDGVLSMLFRIQESHVEFTMLPYDSSASGDA
ncbi:Rad1/Rec1/Rad17 [Zychaea mexicana]|uniref:Rad1/Rec1/Rad17 n=1 Tax=Zychaea mexicana TaxID=64656 RepID=UPI0022FE07E6|nr:Rad1/Rec1/Rad17 [Zychaea mexicana]KAI9499179.1 Rad1/Rec1/Rad17 [Zychaea mexicana]